MNKDDFLLYVKNNRDCEQDKLDTAVFKGLQKAGSNKTDTGKIFLLAAAAVFTFLLSLTVNMKPFKLAAEGYYQNWHKTMPGVSEALNSYIFDMADNINKIQGGY